MKSKLFRSLGVFALAAPLLVAEANAQSLSPGVEHHSSGNNHHLKVDLNDPDTQMGVSYAEPINRLKTTLQHAKDSSREGFAVIGGVNASFFEMNDTNRLPFSLITEHNRIINYGTDSPDSSHYRQHPIVFGVTEDGKARIDRFDSALSGDGAGRSLTIHNMNAQRAANTLTMYTPQFVTERSGTNEYGVDVVIRGANQDTLNTFGFGDRIEAQSKAFTRMENLEINGFQAQALFCLAMEMLQISFAIWSQGIQSLLKHLLTLHGEMPNCYLVVVRNSCETVKLTLVWIRIHGGQELRRNAQLSV
ncbi:hypothetical protein JCM19037_806 [Geomicrobium sp. JCM 19037]|nr:hypothetical protein JCM19037_806 [Geomicrobium sp. JCM 19037]